MRIMTAFRALVSLTCLRPVRMVGRENVGELWLSFEGQQFCTYINLQSILDSNISKNYYRIKGLGLLNLNQANYKLLLKKSIRKKKSAGARTMCVLLH